jgi:hypothetical protein
MQHSPILIIEMEAMQPHFAQFPSMPPIPVGSVTFGWARSRLGIGLQKRLSGARASSTAVPTTWSDFADEVGDWRVWKVKGYAPSVKDDQLRLFRGLLGERSRTHQMTGATMTGTFYSGKPLKINGRATTLRGYGHMGCCSLFVISSVESVDTDYANDLNYSAGDWNVGLPLGCNSEQMLGLPTNKMLLAWQEAANQGQDEWRYDANRRQKISWGN